MYDKRCWYCDSQLDCKDKEIFECTECGMENDLSTYTPITENKVNKEESMAILDDVKPQHKFFDKKADSVEVGSIGTIETEPVVMGKFNQVTALIDFNGEKRMTGFNNTSKVACVTAWGNDTAAWVGKKVKFSKEDIENKKTNALYRNVCVFRPAVS